MTYQVEIDEQTGFQEKVISESRNKKVIPTLSIADKKGNVLRSYNLPVGAHLIVNEGDQIEHALNIFQYDLKGISFLPATEKGAYKYMPYETISEERCDKMLSKLGDIDFSIVKLDKSAIPDQQLDLFCDGETCSIIPNSDNKQKSIKVDTNEIHIVF